MSAPTSRRPIAAIIVTVVLTLAVAAAGAAYALTENDRQAAALLRSSSDLVAVEKSLTEEIARLGGADADAEEPLRASASRVLDEGARSSLTAAVREAGVAQESAALTLSTTPPPAAPRGFRWFWDDSAPVHAIELRIAVLTESLTDARDAGLAVQNGISRVAQAVTAWETNQTNTLIETADIVNVTAEFAYDGTEPGAEAAQALLDAGGVLAISYPDSELAVVTANSYVNSVALTVDVGDLVTFAGSLTGTYIVATVADITPWTLPTESPADAIAMTAENWDGDLSRFVTLTPHSR